ncbi:Casein kinase I isoform beta [Tritrichomonas foetus]|uniref:non-specific serine/threonine protein kinase n=1 Tax=Tritrichomonas foetus TaxID=1144522 RepID=A0A1J4K2C5_9EUKA|nr:Casein kinase I isoform beta [Tritrichomonas foetus]|eukprot:OHT03900.1 Casein kinase I isoform beta [Tritrichomonas foetus]
MAENESSSQRPKLPYGKAIGRFKVIKCVGQGGYGDIYYVTTANQEFPLALKFEHTNARKQALRREYEYMLRVQGSIHFPRLVSFIEEDHYRYLVMEMLGPSVSNLRRSCPKHLLSLGTTLNVAKTMLSVIQEFHERGMIHRDIKPSNFLLRPGSKDFLCLIDYGLSKKYVDDETGELYEPLEHAGFKGTLKYASPHAHFGDDQGRRDDLFSWFYSIVELRLGKLPWANTKGRTHVLKAKRRYRRSEDILILPNEFQVILRYIEHLKFFQTPDYNYLQNILDQLFEHYQLNKDDLLDWEKISDEQAKKISIFPLKRTDKPVPFPIEDIVKQESTEKAKKKKEEEKLQAEIANSKTRETANKRNASSVVCLLI